MSRRALTFALLAAALAAGVLLAGCGGGGGGETTTTATTATTPIVKVPLRLYFLLGGKVQGARRVAAGRGGRDAIALAALADGPTARERGAGLRTAVPAGARWTLGRAADGTRTLRSSRTLTRQGLAQVVYTLTQFPDARRVEVNGKRYGRADFERETPAILVESPLPFDAVTSPLRARGTANTFEATFQYDLLDAAGKRLKTHFVTATSGTGTRGTFAFTVPFAATGAGKLVVYELSAKDGSRIHQVTIPLRLSG